MSEEDLHAHVKRLTASLKQAEEVRSELDRRIFHLKTLYDMSRDMHAGIEVDAILRSFLLMSMGNFGVLTGFILLADVHAAIERFITLGIQDSDSFSFRREWQKILKQKGLYDSMTTVKEMSHSESFLSPITLTLPFIMDDDTMALLGLAAKLAGDPYTQDDKDLLYTLLNNLSVAIEKAKSFEEIKRLSKPLDVNMGINSGHALVGAAKFESITGSRWTYTARGTLTNVAARISALGSRGTILLSRATADRIRAYHRPTCRGKFKLKNVSEEVEVFEL